MFSIAVQLYLIRTSMKSLRVLPTLALACGVVFPCAAFAQSFPSNEAVLKSIQGGFKEYFELLSMPNDAVVAADIVKNANWLEGAFAKRGFLTRQLPNAGKPVLPEQWAQKSPWQPVVKQRNAAGAWEIVPTDRLMADQLDPELRVFARASSDDKGPIMMFLSAFDALKASGMEPDVNVKV